MSTINSVVADMEGLQNEGYVVHEQWFEGKFDGLSAKKSVHGHLIEVHVAAAEDGGFLTPLVSVDDEIITTGATPRKAARIGEFRALFETHKRRRAA